MTTDGLNPLTVLLFVGAVLAGVTLTILYAFARVTKRQPFARITLRVLLGGVGLYLLLFLGASVSSHSRVLAVGAEKPTDGMKRKLIPGESYTTDIVFNVPADAKGLRLVLRNNDPESAFIIGHENSLLHGKTTFALVKAS